MKKSPASGHTLTIEELVKSQRFLDSDPFRSVQLPSPPLPLSTDTNVVRAYLQEYDGHIITLRTPYNFYEGLARFTEPDSVWFWHYNAMRRTVGSLYILTDLSLNDSQLVSSVETRGDYLPPCWKELGVKYTLWKADAR